MKVAIFTDNDFEKVNGVTVTLRALLAHAGPGFDLRVFTSADRAVERSDYVALRSIGVGIPFYREMRMYVPRLAAFVRRVRAYGAHLVHLTTPGPIGLAALFVAWRLRLPMVGSFHTDLAAYASLLSGSARLGRLMREYMRWPYGQCRRILVPSESTRRLLVAAKMSPAKIEVWTRGVDADAFSPARRSEALRRAWGASDERPAILYAGRVSREKGLHRMPAILAGLDRLGVSHRLVVVGDGPMRPELERDLPDAVFTGMLPHDKVAVAMASADVFLFPSRTDTAGNVVLEAQASGLPVLVTGEGGPKDNMVPGRTGFVCHRDDPWPFAIKAAELLVDTAKRRAVGEAARAYALGRRWSEALEPLLRAYREVGRPRPRPSPGLAMSRVTTTAEAGRER